jgi:hypothetical protein
MLLLYTTDARLCNLFTFKFTVVIKEKIALLLFQVRKIQRMCLRDPVKVQP